MTRLGDVSDFAIPRPLVTLEEYFTGNNDPSSIGDVRIREFTPEQFFTALKALRDRADVYDVRVEVKAPKTPDGRPATDTIWIVTSLDRMELPLRGMSSEFWDRFLPDDWLTFPRRDGRITESLEIPNSMHGFGFYYY